MVLPAIHVLHDRIGACSACRMPSIEHDLPLHLFRASPRLLVTLVRDAFGIELGGPMVAARPCTDVERSTYCAELLLACDASVVVVDVLLAREVERRRSWPLHVASAHATYLRPAWLVVVALDPPAAEWARRPIESFQGGAFAPLVIGRKEVPRVVEAEQAAANPELAVLSALAHGLEPDGEEVAIAALIAAASMPPRDKERAALYANAVLRTMEEQRDRHPSGR